MKRSREPEQDIDPASPGVASTSSTQDSSGPQHAAKYNQIDPDLAVADSDDDDDDSGCSAPAVNMRCLLPPHGETLSFASYDDYEAHYNSFHTNRCLECRKNFPSQHLLGVHIEECHDPIVRVKRDQGEHTVRCTQPLLTCDLPHGMRSCANWVQTVFLLCRGMRPQVPYTPKAPHAHD